jgi:arylsulfatase A-like enzyme
MPDRGRRLCAFLLLAAGTVACRDRSQPFVRLPLPETESVTKSGETRPGCWLSPGDAVVWEIPPGPSRRLEGAYESSLSGQRTGHLDVALRPDEPGAAGWRRSVPVSPDAGWNRWSVQLPPTETATRLEMIYRDATPVAAVRSLFLSEPALLAPQRRRPRTIVLFLIDTLRADHVSGYGYARPTTPALDRFFEGWLRAPTCLPAANWTLPSHASLFLSQSVAHHGVGRFGRLLPQGVETLAGIVGKAGYRTLAVTGGGFVDPAFGFARGFDRYEVLEKPASAAVERALALLAEHREEPVFLFLHTYQVHDYAPEESVAKEMFGDLSALGPNWPDSAGKLASTLGADPRFPDWIRARYDAALRSVDIAFGGLVDGLDRLGRLSDTAILFTSDHGEALCSHSWKGECLGWTHGNPYLYEEELAVPLEIRIPWRADARGSLPGIASLLDVAPTLAEAAGAPAPGSFEGRSLLSAPLPPERGVATEAPPLDAVAMRVGRFKLIRRTGAPQEVWFGKGFYRVLPAEECLDLASDPAEIHPTTCESSWGRALRERTDRYLVEAFPDSLVLRVPARDPGTPEPAIVVRVRGREGPPALRTFGLAGRPVALDQERSSTRVRFSSGSAPVWLAFEPLSGSRAVEVRVEGPGALVTASGGAAASDGRGWSELGWPSGRSLPDVMTVFTTPPSERFSADATPLPNDVVTRLLALGYLRGSPSLPPGLGAATPGAGADLPDLPAGQVRIFHVE